MNQDSNTSKPKPKTVDSRVYFADVLRAIAIFAVIILHNAADYADQYGEIPMSHWWAGDIWNGVVRFCVPMFVMLSGAFLLKAGKVVTAREVFTKRLPKIVIPLVFWSIIYVLSSGYNSETGIKGINILEQLKAFYNGPVGGAYQLWFLYMLIGIYLLYPIINFFITAAQKQHIEYFLIVWFIINSVIGILNMIFNIETTIEFNFFTGYVGYFVLGYYLFNYTFSKQQLSAAYFLGLLGVIVSCTFPYFFFRHGFEDTHSLIESDFTPDVVFCEIALFLYFRTRQRLGNRKGVAGRILRFITKEISKESFGIYFVHVLLIGVLFSETPVFGRLSEQINDMHPAWSIPIKSVIVIIISYLISKLIRQIPYLRKVVG